MGRIKSLLIVGVIYFFAGAIVWFSFSALPGKNDFIKVLSADILATIVVFIFSFIFRNSSIYDPYWSVVPPLIALYLIWVNPAGLALRQYMVLGVVLFWSVRLTSNWIRGWKGLKHEDWRYQRISGKTGKYYWPVSFLGIHLMPTIFVFLGCLPLFYVMADEAPLSPFEFVALLVSVSAILLEWVSDEQLRSFRKINSSEALMQTGLWGRMRHPNYLGEIVFWFGIYLFVPLDVPGKTFWTGIGFFSMIFLFNFISVPLMDEHNFQRRQGYAKYVKNVPALMPSLSKIFMKL
jgi:steroid 5-alpha reductase family enzyme